MYQLIITVIFSLFLQTLVLQYRYKKTPYEVWGQLRQPRDEHSVLSRSLNVILCVKYNKCPNSCQLKERENETDTSHTN